MGPILDMSKGQWTMEEVEQAWRDYKASASAQWEGSRSGQVYLPPDAPDALKDYYSKLGASVESQRTKAEESRKLLARADKHRVDWAGIKKSLAEFNDILKRVEKLERAGDDRIVASLDARIRRYLAELDGGHAPSNRGSPLYPWLLMHWPLLKERQTLNRLEANLAEAADALLVATLEGRDTRGQPLSKWVKNLTSWMKKYAEELNSFVSQASSEQFKYRGLNIFNESRMPDSQVKELLTGIDYVFATFKKKGVQVLLEKTLQSVILSPDLGKAGGLYHPTLRAVSMSAVLLAQGGGKLLEKWVNEVFLHEIGHHVHMTLMHPQAKAEWDSGWDDVEKARMAGYVFHEDRVRFFGMLVRSAGYLNKVKLKGLDRMKFHAWMSEPMLGASLVTPKQLRWSKDGAYIQRFLNDPYGYFADRYEEHEIPEQIENLYDRLKEKMGLNVGIDVVHPRLNTKEVGKYSALDDAVRKAIDDLEVPTKYARTNELEDFAESFVAFLAKPEKLSKRAKLRMQRALHQSGLYGKPIMRSVDAKVVAQMLRDAAAALTT